MVLGLIDMSLADGLLPPSWGGIQFQSPPELGELGGGHPLLQSLHLTPRKGEIPMR